MVETSGEGECALANIPTLGISTSKNGVNFGLSNFREQGIFGLSTLLPADATVTLKVKLTVLTQGEFWIALSNDLTPESRMSIIALQPQSGGLRIYTNQTNRFTSSYAWNQIASGANLPAGPPYLYTIKLVTSGNKVNPQIHFTSLPSQTVNLPKYLFIGYNNKSALGSMTLQAEIIELTVDAR